MLIPLDPRVYWRLQWSAFAWGLFYFGLYALFVLVIVVDNIAQGPPHFFFRVGGFLTSSAGIVNPALEASKIEIH
jgi:hypothetical protein